MLWTDMYSTTTTNNNNMYKNDHHDIFNMSTRGDFQTELRQQDIYTTPNQFHATGSVSSGTDEEINTNYRRTSSNTSLKRKSSSESDETSEEKRKNFLERNRQAALKCRQRKKQWLNNLQERVEFLANDNEQLQLQANIMRDEVQNLRNLLLMHKDCPMNNNFAQQSFMSHQLQQQSYNSFKPFNRDNLMMLQ